MSNAHISPSFVTPPRAYQPRLFVKRESDLDKVKQKIKEARAGKISKPIINFWGVQGIGKTWLLSYLYDHYQYDPTHSRISLDRPTFAILYTFNDNPDSASLSHITRYLASEIRKQLTNKLSNEDDKVLRQAEGSGNPKDLISVFNNLSRSYLPILLFDNAEKINDDSRDQLEQQFIEPLAVNNRILIVLAGRRYVPRWQRFEVRKRVTEYNETQIQAFDKEAAEKQINLSDYHVPIEWIYPLTGGNPYLTDLLASRMADWDIDEPFDESRIEQYHLNLVPLLKNYEDELLKPTTSELRPIFYAVAFLRTFRLEALRFMLGSQEVTDSQPVSYYVGLLHRLDRETEVVWWSHEARAYVIDPTVRRIIDRRKMLENPTDYIAVHQKAYKMYRLWAEKFPEVSEDFIKEIFFHLGSIFQATKDEAALEKEFDDIMKLALRSLRPDGLFVLRNLYDEKNGDQELMELLPDKLCKKIFDSLAPS